VNISAVFIVRPVATTLLTAGILLAGLMGFVALPVSPLPKVDFPTIQMQAVLPGASPDTVATSVTTPLEKRLGAIAGVSEITSTSTVGNAYYPAVRPVTRHRRSGARHTGPHGSDRISDVALGWAPRRRLTCLTNQITDDLSS
jgi:hypothetical protein